ncbi:hypothetical protein GCM10009525_87740 [Streptosporangium amethystogenes subsp. fukuiense]
MSVAMADLVRDALSKHTQNRSEPPLPVVRRGTGGSRGRDRESTWHDPCQVLLPAGGERGQSRVSLR